MTFSKNILANIAASILLLILGSIVVFYQFTAIPPKLNKDEEEFAKLAMALESKPYTAYSPLATGHATLYFYIILASFYIFGFNEFGLRFPAAMFGVLNIVIFFLLLKSVFSLKIKPVIIFAFLGALILITQRWYINFARFAFEPTFLLFLELLSTYFIFTYRENKITFYLIVSGVFAGLAYNSYTPGRIFFVLPATVLLHEVISSHFSWKRLKPLGIFFLSFGIVILPLTMYLSQHTDLRVYDQFFITNEKLSIMTRLTYLGQNIVNNASMLFFKGDVNGIHNYPYKPALNPVIGTLFLGGLILSFINKKNIFSLFFILYFIISVIPTIFTYPWENPNMLRTFTVLPAIAYFVVLAIAWLYEKIRYKILFIIIVVILLIGSSFYELRTYFVFQSKVFKDIFTSSIRFENFRHQETKDL